MPEHGDIVPGDAADNRGNHSIEGVVSVADETALAALAFVAGERGKVVFVSGGNAPGWYIVKPDAEPQLLAPLDGTPDQIVGSGSVEWFDPSTWTAGGGTVSAWDSGSSAMSLSPLGSNPPLLSAAAAAEIETENPNYGPFEDIAGDNWVSITGGNGFSGSFPVGLADNEDLYIACFAKTTSIGEVIGVESLAFAHSASQAGAFIKRKYDGGTAKFRRTRQAIQDNTGYWELMYKRPASGFDAEMAIAYNGTVHNTARATLDYRLHTAPTNLYVGDDGSGTLLFDGAGGHAFRSIVVVSGYMPTPIERIRLMRWASGVPLWRG